jgi:hypothetical protein
MFLVKSGLYLRCGLDYAESKEFKSVAKTLTEAADSIYASITFHL